MSGRWGQGLALRLKRGVKIQNTVHSFEKGLEPWEGEVTGF